MAPPNVIIFGETGSGKSSIVNLLAGADLAATSSSSVGCTFESAAYPIQFNGSMYVLHDTAGLDEGDQGTVAKQDAIVNLYRLLRELESGVSLLIFCMQGPRIKESCVRNWKLFYEIICQEKVPIVLAVTRLEGEEDMDAWWNKNSQHFMRYNMVPNAVACITGTRGKYSQSRGEHIYQSEYDESREKIRDRVRHHHSNPPWQVERAEWFKTIVEITFKSTKGGVEEIKTNKTVFGSALNKLLDSGIMEKEEAQRLAEAMKDI